MQNILILLLFVCAGVFLQSFLFVPTLFSDPAKKKKELLIILLLVVLITSTQIVSIIKKTPLLSYQEIIFESLLLYAIMFIFMFKKDILPYINEGIILQVTVISVYFAITSKIPSVFTYILFIVVPYVIFLVVSKHEPKPITRLLLYVWFLIMSATIIGIMMYARFMRLDQIAQFSALDAFLGGMIALRFFTPVFYLFQLIPIPGRHQSISERIILWKDDVALMTKRYSTFQLKTTTAILAVSLQTILLALNYFLHMLPEWVVIDGSFLLFGAILTNQINQKTK